MRRIRTEEEETSEGKRRKVKRGNEERNEECNRKEMKEEMRTVRKT